MFKIDNYSDSLEIIDTLIKYYFKCNFSDLELLEDGVYYVYDTSFHGSPHYQYHLITNDENKIELFKILINIRNNILTVKENKNESIR